MDIDVDLYEDLPEETNSDHIAKLEQKIEILEKNIKKLEHALSCCERQNKDLSKTNEILLTNISSLYRTAKKETERKDNMIRDLRQEIDDIVFRRRKIVDDNNSSLLRVKPVSKEKEICSTFSYSSDRSYHRRVHRSNSNERYDRISKDNRHKSREDSRNINDDIRKYDKRCSFNGVCEKIKNSKEHRNANDDIRKYDKRYSFNGVYEKVKNSKEHRSVNDDIRKYDKRCSFNGVYEKIKNSKEHRSTNDEIKKHIKSKIVNGHFKQESSFSLFDYDTPMKIVKNEMLGFSSLTLVSPIGATPDHIKEKLIENSVKISPIPMLNEFRILEENEKSALPPNVVQEESKKVENKDSSNIVNMSATKANNSIGDLEQGTFTRKRKRPRISVVHPQICNESQ
ncbi:hypothetical protein PGB90_006009 [Kerria lacca]